jgi:hypothetical protein
MDNHCTQLERIKQCQSNVNTVAEDNKEQPVEQLQCPQSRPSCQKEEVDTDGGVTIGPACHESLMGSTNREMVTICQTTGRRQVYLMFASLISRSASGTLGL